VENAGVLTASGLIAGESVFGLLWAALIAMSFAHQSWLKTASDWSMRITSAKIFEHPLYLAGMGVIALLAALLIWLRFQRGRSNEPAPPTAIM